MSQETLHERSAPALSVIMSVYNGERYLSQAVNSIVEQSFDDFEFLVVDDCSTDGTSALCGEYASRDRRIRVIKNDKNIGLTRSLNKALGLARGKYVARMDADDVSLPRRFERQLTYLDSNPSVGLVGSFYREIDCKGEPMEVFQFPTDPVLIKWRMCFENPIPHPAVMIRKSLLDDLGGYDETWRTSQDYELFTRISQKARLTNLPQVLYLWRRHEKSVSSRENKEQRENALLISQKYVSDLLQRNVPLELIHLLWQRDRTDVKDLVRLSTVLYELCRMIAAEDIWSRQEQKLLRRYVALKIFNYIRPHLARMRTWQVVTRSFLLSPSIFGQILFSKIQKSLNPVVQ